MEDPLSGPCTLKIVAYVTSWCPDCHRSHRTLQRLGAVAAEIDIERVVGADAAMRAANGGSGKVPTILIDGPGGCAVLVEPSDRELTDAVRRCREADTRHHDDLSS